RLISVTHHDDGLAAELGRDVVARLGDLALMPDIQPGAAEDPAHLELENTRIGIDAAADAPRLNQTRDVIRIAQHGLCSFRTNGAIAGLRSALWPISVVRFNEGPTSAWLAGSTR